MRYPQARLATAGAFALAMMMSMPAAAQEAFEQHGVHQHGLVTVNVAVDGQALRVEVHSPADSVIGFEHAPRPSDERARVQEMNAWLRAGRGMVLVPAAARCRLDRAAVAAPQWGLSQDHQHHDHVDGEHGHNDRPVKNHARHAHLSTDSGGAGSSNAGAQLVAPSHEHPDAAKRDAGQGGGSSHTEAQQAAHHGNADDGAGHDHHHDYRVTLDYHCDQPAALRWLQLKLLERLNNVQQVRVHVLTPTRQATDTLTDPTTRVQLR